MSHLALASPCQYGKLHANKTPHRNLVRYHVGRMHDNITYVMDPSEMEFRQLQTVECPEGVCTESILEHLSIIRCGFQVGLEYLVRSRRQISAAEMNNQSRGIHFRQPRGRPVR
jgi:hypothetical protein